MIFSRIREAIRWRRWKARRLRYLRSTFRNGDELARTYLDKTPCPTAVLRDGTVFRHPPARTGLAGMLLEVWFDQVYTGRFYTPKPGDVVIDAGANVGAFSVLVARTEPRCRVIAFEPFAENFELLKENLGAALGTTVTAHRAALAGTAALAVMADGGHRSQDHRLVPVAGTDGNPDAIPTRPLAEVLADAGGEVALFKCDIEGSEFDLFGQADPALFRQVRRFAVEYHDNVRPGTRELLERLLSPTHTLEIQAENEYGMLYATRKG